MPFTFGRNWKMWTPDKKTSGLSRPRARSGATESIEAVLASVEEKYLDALQVTLIAQCQNILEKAINFRESAPGKHDYTGNLLTGIMVGLFRKGKLIGAISPEDEFGLPSPVRTQMSHPYKYFFKRDYEGGESKIKPPVVADTSLHGAEQAYKWIRRNYKTSRKHYFEILVVYGADYASWVEHERGTAGFANTVAYIKSVDWSYGIPPF